MKNPEKQQQKTTTKIKTKVKPKSKQKKYKLIRTIVSTDNTEIELHFL